MPATELTEGEITRATFWIRRWKLVGGGFIAADLGDANSIEPSRREDPDPRIEAKYAVAATALIDELRNDRRKAGHVFQLVAHALDAREPPQQTMNAAIIDQITSGQDAPAPANDTHEGKGDPPAA